MKVQDHQSKQQLIDEIIRLQEDFEALTNRSNALQHQNQYFQTQLIELEKELSIKRASKQSTNSNQVQQHVQPQWPLYIAIQGDQLPQLPGEYIKFTGNDGKLYVQCLQLIQHTQIESDGKTQKIVREQYMIVQQPLQMFESKYGPFDQLNSVISSPLKNDEKQETLQEKQSQKKQQNQDG